MYASNLWSLVVCDMDMDIYQYMCCCWRKAVGRNDAGRVYLLIFCKHILQLYITSYYLIDLVKAFASI
jgi:hypothetical protein